MEEYKGWPCYEEIPDGWHIDKTAGSPLHGYEFIINGSPLRGGKRALVRVYKDALRVSTQTDIKEMEMITRYEKMICKAIAMEQAAMRAKNPAFKAVWMEKARAERIAAYSLTIEQAQEVAE